MLFDTRNFVLTYSLTNYLKVREYIYSVITNLIVSFIGNFESMNISFYSIPDIMSMLLSFNLVLALLF